jgi:hypothetical protein
MKTTKPKTKKVKAWILTDDAGYFHVSIKKFPSGFISKYVRIPCTITYTEPKK